MSAIKEFEKSLKADKQKAERLMESIIYKHTEGIVKSFVAEAENGSFQHGSYLLDRGFGKTRQNIGIDGGSEGAPIVFMPAALIQKFGLDKPIEAELVEEPNIYEAE